MDIGRGNTYPANALSNFAPHPFIFDGVSIASMEGFLQSLKFPKIHVQEQVCKLIGKAAKMRGKERDWRITQTLYWQGVAYPRKSKEYQDLLDRAYLALTQQSDSFQRALKASNNAVLTHSIGKSKESETVPTEREFCSKLTKMRNEILK